MNENQITKQYSWPNKTVTDSRQEFIDDGDSGMFRFPEYASEKQPRVSPPW